MKLPIFFLLYLMRAKHLGIRFSCLCVLVTWSIFSPPLGPLGATSFAEEAPKPFFIPQPPPDADQAAAKGMIIVEKIVKNDETEAETLGFTSSDEVTADNMQIGRAIPVMEITFEKLQSSNRHPAQWLVGKDHYIYPITVGGKVRSSITVRKMKTGKWRAVGFGAVGGPLAAEERNILDSAFIVRFYALDRVFLGTSRDNELAFFRVAKHSHRTEDPENGQKVFEDLAKEIKGLDPKAFGKRYRLRPPQPKTYSGKE
jgi:hypothetical protein